MPCCVVNARLVYGRILAVTRNVRLWLRDRRRMAYRVPEGCPSFRHLRWVTVAVTLVVAELLQCLQGSVTLWMVIFLLFEVFVSVNSTFLLLFLGEPFLVLALMCFLQASVVLVLWFLALVKGKNV